MSNVFVKIRDGFGVVGHDRKDWLGGEVHECDKHFADSLHKRGLADIVEAPGDGAVDPNVPPADPEKEPDTDPESEAETAPDGERGTTEPVETRDPAPENRDPGLSTSNAAPVARGGRRR